LIVFSFWAIYSFGQVFQLPARRKKGKMKIERCRKNYETIIDRIGKMGKELYL